MNYSIQLKYVIPLCLCFALVGAILNRLVINEKGSSPAFMSTVLKSPSDQQKPDLQSGSFEPIVKKPEPSSTESTSQLLTQSKHKKAISFNPPFNELTYEEIDTWYIEFSNQYASSGSFSSTDRELIPFLKLAKSDIETLVNLYFSHPDDAYLEMSLDHSMTIDDVYLIEDFIERDPILMQIAISAGMYSRDPARFDNLLRKKLDSNAPLISNALIEVSAHSVKGTSYEDALVKYSVEGLNRFLTFESLEKSGFDNLAVIANKIWKGKNIDPLEISEWDEIMINYTAAKYGNKTAMDEFIHLYKTSTELVEYDRLFRSMFAGPITVQDYEQNKEAFEFDTAEGKWTQ